MDMNTPDTDANVWSDSCEGILCKVVSAEFARRLERERDEAREHLDNMQDQRDFAMKVIKRLEQERDEARKMNNPTPETDAAWKEGNAIREWTCRKLERERDDAREEVNKLSGAYEDATNYYARIIELKEELDEANEALHKQLVQIDQLFDEAEKIRRERDEAREEVKLLKAILDLIKKDVS